MRPSFLALPLAGAFLIGVLAPLSSERGPEVARGVVFHDRNGDGRRGEDEPGLTGVRVSNGREVVKTGAEGRYELPMDAPGEVFVIKPRGWMVPVDALQRPRFYYVHRPQGSPGFRYPGVAPTGPLPESIDFPLFVQEEPESFRALFFGDTQPRNQQEVDWIAHDVVDELVGFDGAFGVTLGDLVFDDLSLFEPLDRAIARIGLPWFHVLGNHDMNCDARLDAQANETYARSYGPATYAFDWGPVHFIALDDVFWEWREAEDKGGYRGLLTPRVLEFVANDLAGVPDDRLIVLMMHIPLTGVENRGALFDLIEDRPYTLSIAAHMHVQEHVYFGEKSGWNGAESHHHVINVTACGSWWAGAPDERGIPHAMMTDGAPNGYSVFNFDGQSYSMDFRAAGRPASWQMDVTVPDEVPRARLAEAMVFVNLFNGSERSTARMRIDGADEWIELEKVEQGAPRYLAAIEAEVAVAGRTWRDLPNPTRCKHLWRAHLPTDLERGLHMLEVEAQDAFGRTQTAWRTFRVERWKRPGRD